jgi:lipopolysaccharide export LptBFGC system permease protein LptF
MLYFLPITLTFVLPIAALFACSMVYGRFAADNELDACRASGISITTLVYPGLGLAILMAISNLLLSFYVMPAFVQHAEKEIKADAKQIIFRNIERKGYYKPPQGDYLIRADYTDYEASILSGVAITELDKSRIGRIVACETAKVNFNQHERFNEIRITSQNTVQIGIPGEGGFFTEQMSLSKEFGSLMTDSIKFKDIGEIKRIRDVNPLRFYPIEKVARRAYAELIIEMLAKDISRSWDDKNSRFYQLNRADEKLKFKADNCSTIGTGTLELTGNVVVQDNTSEPSRTLYCEKGFIHIEGDEFAPTLTMELRSATWTRSDGVEILDRRPLVYGLLVPDSVTSKIASSDVLKTLKPDNVKNITAEPSVTLIEMIKNLQEEISDTMTDIKAEIHSRLVFGIGCIPMILIGIGLGIIKKDGHLLSAFGASVVPALVLIVCIMSGKQLTKSSAASQVHGVLVMWAGVVLLCCLTIWLYRKLLKN